MRLAFRLSAVMGISSFMAAVHGQAKIPEAQGLGASAIPAQPLASALQSWAQDTGWQLMYDSGLAIDLQSSGTPGGMSAIESLSQLLAGTQLEHRFLNERTVLILPSTGETSVARLHHASTITDDSSGMDHNGTRESGQTGTHSANQNSPESDTRKHNSSSNQREDIEEVVVTAQKREERLQDVPISVSVMTGDDLDRSSFASLTDVLGKIPGVVTQTSFQGGGTLVAIRGVSASGPIASGGSPIAYYLDTVPFGFVKSAIGPDSNPYDLERLEVLKGPQGTLYGASAQNGIVRVLTHNADLNDFEFKMRTSGSSTDSSKGENYSGDVAVNVPIVEGKLAARAVVGYQRLSGWIDNLSGHDTNDTETQNYRLKINAQPTQNLSVGLSAWSTRNDYGSPPMSDDHGVFNGTESQATTADFDVYGFTVGYEAPHVAISSATSYLFYENNGLFDLTPIGMIPGIEFFLGQTLLSEFHSRVLSEELLFNSANTELWKWSFGAFYRDAKDTTYQELPVVWGGVSQNLRDTSESYAIFGEIGRRFLDHFEWTLGLRYFHDNVTSEGNSAPSTDVLGPVTQSFNATTPRAVLSWRPSPELTTYASYGQGFRSGFTQQAPVVAVFPQIPPVKPDTLDNYEVGAKGDLWNDHLSYEAAIYYMKWKDVQQASLIEVQPKVAASAPLNGESASGMGVDLGVTARPLDRLNVGLSLSWNNLTQDSDVFIGGFQQIRAGDRLNFSSEYTAAGSVDYTVALGGDGFEGEFSASATYFSGQLNTLLNPSGPSTIEEGDDFLFTRGAFTLRSPNDWSAMLYVDNVGNEDGGSASGNGVPSYTGRMRPRTIGVQLDYAFK